ncbi:hypothetical protein [Microtetraspora malaysiensis]|uniref:hypothetical protein n=1 Tax=Microtetraspora malaysiensis TaxID=161358 RepID=UPI003D8C212A
MLDGKSTGNAAATLRDRTQKRLAQVTRLLSGRITLDQHRELLVITGWLTALLGCVHSDLGEREEAETARQAAFGIGGVLVGAFPDPWDLVAYAIGVVAALAWERRLVRSVDQTG